MVAAVLEARHEADGSGVSIDGGAAVALVDDSAAMLSRETPPVSAAGSGTTPRSGSVRTIGQFPPRDKKQRLGASDSDNDFQRTVLLKAVARNGRELRKATPALRQDREVVLAAVGQNGHALKYAAVELLMDKAFLLDAVAENGDAMKCVGQELAADPAFVLDAVAADGKAMMYAAHQLRSSPEFVLEAIKRSPWALRFAHPSLWADKPFVLQAVAAAGNSLQFATPDLRFDRTFVLDAVTQNAVALEFILLLKDLLYLTTVPHNNKKETTNTKIQPFSEHERPSVRVFAGSFTWGIVALSWVLLYITTLQTVLPEYQWDVHEPCSVYLANKLVPEPGDN
jgi:hypothetical protein